MHLIDSHTEGEPTRVVIAGGPDLGTGTLTERAQRLADQHDDLRKSVVLEPRGSDVVVGALLCEPDDPESAAGVFFNNVGYLGMCGHGAIGVAVTLAYLNRISPGDCRLDTPVGTVQVHLSSTNEVTIENVPSYRYRQGVDVDVAGLGLVTGDIAWGGNWFFLVTSEPPVPLTRANIPVLLTASRRIRSALTEQQITGSDGQEIDHVEFFGPGGAAGADSRNFVLCPGGEYDRSPCGTGTSAKLACLAADGKLAPGVAWAQESIIGSRFQASYRQGDSGMIIPQITGRAFVFAEVTPVWQSQDPFAHGIPSHDD